MTPLQSHLLRLEIENSTEKWANVPDGTFEKLYASKNLAAPLYSPGWARVWVLETRTGQIVAHASLFDIGEWDIVGGHISVERPYRKHRHARTLQDMRLAFCDKHGLTLTGPIAVGNDTSWFGCRRMGFKFARYDKEERQVWVYREPRLDTTTP